MATRKVFDGTTSTNGETVYSSAIYWNEFYSNPVGSISGNFSWYGVTVTSSVVFDVVVTMDGTNYIASSVTQMTAAAGVASGISQTLDPCLAFKIKAVITTTGTMSLDIVVG
jgi:hypothetical protein